MDGQGAPSRNWWEELVKDSDEWNELKEKCLIINPHLTGAWLDFWIRQMHFGETFESWATLPEDQQTAWHNIRRAEYALRVFGETDRQVQFTVTGWEKEYLVASKKRTSRKEFEKKMQSIVDVNVSKLRAEGVLMDNETLEDVYIKETLEKKYRKDGEKRNALAPDTTAAQPKQRGRTIDDSVSPPFKRQALSSGKYKAIGVETPEVSSHVANEMSTNVSLSTTPPTLTTDHTNNATLFGFPNGHQGDTTMSATDGHDDGGQADQSGETAAEVTQKEKKKKHRPRGKRGQKKKKGKNDTVSPIINNANATNGVPSDTFQNGDQVDDPTSTIDDQMEGLDQAHEAGNVVEDPASEAKKKPSKMTALANTLQMTNFPYMADGKEVGENQQVVAKAEESQEVKEDVKKEVKEDDKEEIDDDSDAWDAIYGK